MQVVSVDTHKIVSLLREKGFTQKQAEGLLEAVQEIDLSNIATRADTRELKSEVQAFRQEARTERELDRKEIRSHREVLEQKMENSILKVKTDLITWFLPLILGLYGILVVNFYLR